MSTTFFSAAAALSFAASSTAPSAPKSHSQQKPLTSKSQLPQFAASLIPLAAAASIALSSVPLSLASDSPFHIYYGTAASAANYGGYGGNASKQATAEYIYEVPDGWKERLVSKVEKGTNGTDSEFYNPKKRSEHEYLTFLSDIRGLAPVDAVLGNLALSDVALQDQIAEADSVRSEERRDDNGQIYYAYEIDGGGKHSLIAVTCKGNKLYAHFVSAPAAEWTRDESMLRRLHESFKTFDPQASSKSP